MGAGGTSGELRGPHEVGGAPRGRALHPRGQPGLPWRALQAHQVGFLPKLTTPVDFVPF